MRQALIAPPPLTLYIHIPWCVRKCPYCDFNSHGLRDDLPEAAYVAALTRDLEFALPSIWGRPIEAVFASFDADPVASASIAQVHFGVLHDGREVIVKIVRPNIRPQIIQDFEILAWILPIKCN